jgi:hypothetical protein
MGRTPPLGTPSVSFCKPTMEDSSRKLERGIVPDNTRLMNRRAALNPSSEVWTMAQIIS